jgi:hypothetical protein
MSNSLSRGISKKIINASFPGTVIYWERRYRKMGNSGIGSYGASASHKAKIINEFVLKNSIIRVVDFGCGDGNQLRFLNFPCYLGIDVSLTAIRLCQQIFKKDTSKQFSLYDSSHINAITKEFNADLSISLDVVFHLVEEDVFEKYMKDLFMASSRFVIIYAWDVDGERSFHVRQRNFSRWIKDHITDFSLKEVKENQSDEHFCNFFIYERHKNDLLKEGFE